jgi:hypothetical protein
MALSMHGGETFFGLAFWQQLLATLVGVVVGIPIALWLNRQQERREATTTQAARDRRRRQLLTAVKNEAQSNREALQTIARAIESGKIESAPLWISVLEGTAAIKYELLEVPICEALDELLYLLRAVDGFQRLQLGLLFDPQAHLSISTSTNPNTTFFLERHPRVLANLKDAVAKAQGQVEKVLAMPS